MGTAAKQQKLEESEIPETASIPVDRQRINCIRLHPWESDILKAAWQRDLSCNHTVWFRDTEAVRQVLRKHGLLEESK